jgi:hypothetical protein
LEELLNESKDQGLVLAIEAILSDFKPDFFIKLEVYDGTARFHLQGDGFEEIYGQFQLFYVL